MSHYNDYADVPFYRKQWFFWLTYLLFNPVALLVLITGDVYYERHCELRSFGTANRIVAGLAGMVFLFRVFGAR